MLHLELVQQQGSNPRSVYIGDLKNGELWKGLEWKKIMSGWVKKGTLLKIYDSAAPSRQNPVTRTVVISSISFSRELALVPPVAFEGLDTKEIVSYAYLMALSDQKGNIFILDFVKNKFWLLARTGVTGTAVEFNSTRRRELFVAMADHSIHCYNIDTCQLIAKLPAIHQSTPESISVHPTRHLAISTSASESILWDTEIWERKRVMEGMDLDAGGVQQTSFSPDGLMICTAFEDGSIFFWSIDTFSLVWKITLSNLVDRKPINASVLDATEFATSMKKSLKIPRNSFFALSSNAELFAYGGLSSTLYIWNLFEKRLVHEILIPSFNDSIISQIEFLANTDVLALLSSAGDIIFINATHATFVSQLKGKNRFITFSVSPDGRCLSTITSESRYMTSLVRLDEVLDPQSQVNRKISAPVVQGTDGQHESTAKQDQPVNESTEEKKQERIKTTAYPPKTFFQLIEAQQESTMFNRSKLRGFLNHYGSYPDQYRPLIWRYLLKLPENRAGYESLLDQGTHASFKEFRKKFPLKSDRAAKSMERILSCLAFWSPIFEDLDYLPALVFPFVKLFWNDLFSCLEVIMTILVNWCQKWWEYYPNPPIETLELISQLIQFHDPQLFDHFNHCKITAQIYGWTLMQSLFSELFSKKDWMMVWDHIVSNPPSFFYHFIAAYIIHFRRVLLGIHEQKDFYFFFQKRNATSIPSIILKAYEIKAKTPTSIDPSSFLKPFTPFPPGEYPVFNQYPQFIVNYQSRMKNKIRQEEHEYIKKRQLATELSRLTEELRKEKEGWESTDWKMNEMIEKWWAQMMENEEERGKIRSRMNQLEKEKRLDAMTQIEQARKSILKGDSNYNRKSSPRGKWESMKFTDSLFDGVENEWASRKEEMANTRRKVALDKQSEAEKLIKKVASLSVDTDKKEETPPVGAAAQTSITTVDPLTSDGDLKLVDLTAIAPTSEYSPTKSVSFRLDNSSEAW